ncbi:glycosyltransferase [Sphingobacterium sp. DN00404]|uniref:Glycosyltransferase n=1 Tax=Sphingobacterium micropteri TaxID=2763501 RepID=A0ABR7YN95_9SPHI|nr:glycosyltransferase [Sphingobacterium micropteri]MBD1432783.1 glycosyltransferase [Sphingobacterium micropteri]
MKQPKVSVIMPVYNTAPYLDAAIQSVLNQKLEDFELIIVNDGSTDESQSILEYWREKDDRLYVISQSNMGLSRTRNKGLSLAKGTYVYFMDSDDLIHPDTLSTCYLLCQEQNLEFVFFDAHVFSDNPQDNALIKSFNYNRKKTIPYKITTGKEVFEQLLKTNEFFSSVCLLFIKRDFLIEKGLDFEPDIVHEDELFTSMLYLYTRRTTYISKCFFSRRVRLDSIMTVPFSMRNIRSYFIVGQRLLSHITVYLEDKEIIRLYLSKTIDAAVWQAHTMNLVDRLKVLFECVAHWIPYVRWRTLMVLLFKKYQLNR